MTQPKQDEHCTLKVNMDTILVFATRRALWTLYTYLTQAAFSSICNNFFLNISQKLLSDLYALFLAMVAIFVNAGGYHSHSIAYIP